jgi:hypothetical protein
MYRRFLNIEIILVRKFLAFIASRLRLLQG